MLFSYKAKTKNGEIVEGSMEATDRFALARELRTNGNTPISVSEKSQNSFNLNSKFESVFATIKVSEKIVFTKNLSGMLRAGLSLARALSVLEKQTKNPKLNKIIIALSTEINSGGTLSSGLAKYPKVFSKLFISMTKAGEESGNLANALSEIGSNIEKAHTLTKRIRGALIYPGVILSAMIVIGILMFAFVVPTLAKTFTDLGVDLPASTKFIIAIGNFFSNYLILSFVLLIGFVVGMKYLLSAKFLAKYVDMILIRLPLIGNLVIQLNTARTARTISSLLLAGVSITRAIEITGDVVQNVHYKKVLKQAGEAIEKGATLSGVFEEHSKLYPIMMSEMVQVGEETGKLSDMLLDIAIFYEGEIENVTKNMSTIIEPVLMMVVGAAVGFFAVSMITPLYSVMDNIN